MNEARRSAMYGLRVRSYLSLATDLAAEMRAWPEFEGGAGYDVDLRERATGEAVTVRLVEDGDDAHVAITGETGGPLFDRAAGRVAYAMSAHSDHLLVDRHVRENPPRTSSHLRSAAKSLICGSSTVISETAMIA